MFHKDFFSTSLMAGGFSLKQHVDMNIHLGSNRNSDLTKNYKEVLKNHGLKHIIIDSTRISNTFSSLIDHIVISKQCNIFQSGVLPTSISILSLYQETIYGTCKQRACNLHEVLQKLL